MSGQREPRKKRRERERERERDGEQQRVIVINFKKRFLLAQANKNLIKIKPKNKTKQKYPRLLGHCCCCLPGWQLWWVAVADDKQPNKSILPVWPGRWLWFEVVIRVHSTVSSWHWCCSPEWAHTGSCCWWCVFYPAPLPYPLNNNSFLYKSSSKLL